MKNHKQILVIGNVGTVGLVQFAQDEILKYETEKKTIESQLIGLGYESNAEQLAHWLILEAENVSIATGKSISGLDLLQAYQNNESSEILSKTELSGIKAAFENLGKSLKAVSIRLGDLDIEMPKTNTKWYNNLKPKRRKR